MKKKARELQFKAYEAKSKLNLGIINYDEAKKEIQPYIDYVNHQAVVIAKKHKVKPRFVDVIGFLR